MHSESGSYHGFFWFYFINEHVLRFLNLRYPRDYNTVPRLYFWLFHLLWLFPWSVYFPAAVEAGLTGSRTGPSRVRLLALCWAGFILVFFTFSTTQEYYSMPCYPALALLLGSAIDSEDRVLRFGTKALAVVATLAAAAIVAILWMVRGMAAPGDISVALSQNPELYTLSLGHMADLTLRAFAYLRLPLAVAGVAFAVGAVGAWSKRSGSSESAALSALTDDGLFFHAARLALVVFDPYMSSRPLAEALLKAASGAADRGRSVLHVLLGFLLHQPAGAAAEWTGEQPGVRILRPGRAPGRVHQRCGSSRLWPQAATLLPTCGRTGSATPG